MEIVPSWDSFMVPVLGYLADGEVRRIRTIREQVAQAIGLTDQARSATLPSGEPMASNRVAWATSYLTRVAALERPARGHYRITDLGRQMLVSYPNGITEHQLRDHAIDSDDWWSSPSRSVSGPTSTAPTSAVETLLDPEEQIAQGVARINDDAAADLLSRLHAQEPAFFEQAVLDLLMAMGYGGADGAATRTQLSNDGGIDGVIDQDALGLSRVHIQAKRYAPESAVGRPDLQAFVGAMAGSQATQGVFMTTGRFSQGATLYADAVPTRLVLIDGRRFTSLMIRYGVGVQVKETVHIVEVDEDYFE